MLFKGVNVEILVFLGIIIVVFVVFSNFIGIVFLIEIILIYLYDIIFDVVRLWCLYKLWIFGYK